MHSYKKVIYDRIDDADVKVTSTSQIASMYIRKQNIFTEKKVYKYVKFEDLRLDLLSLCRQRAVNKRADHPWKDLNNKYSFDVKVSYISESLNAYGRTLDENETLKLSENEKAVLRVVVRNEDAAQKDISRETNLAVGTVKRLMGNLQEKGILVRRGSKRTGTWHIKINY